MSMHTHPCSDCGTPIDCDGSREENHDGWPAVICRSFHLSDGTTNSDAVCEGCRHMRETEAS